MKATLRVDVFGLAIAAILWSVPVQEPPVVDAAMQGDAELVQQLIQEGADVNAPHGDGMTALHWAARHRDAEMTRLLLEAGADVTATTRIGAHTPLHVASRSGAGSVMRALLEAGSDPQATTTTTGVSPFHLAAQAGSAVGVAALLDHGADPNVRDLHWGQTPLMVAAAHNRLEAVGVLLDAGAEPALTAKVWDLDVRSEVDNQARRERSRALQAFRDQDADDEGWRPSTEQVQEAVRASRAVETDGPTFDYEAPRSEPEAEEDTEYEPWSASYSELVAYEGGLTALLMAVREGHTSAALQLLEAGADINQVSAGDRTSPLLMAAINGHFDLAMELVARGADPALASENGATPLYVTLNRRWIPRTRHPQTPDFRQQRTTHLELMEALLEAGADPNAQLKKELWYHMFGQDHRNLYFDEVGATTFLRAAHALDLEAMKLLVRYGADPDIPSTAPRRRLNVGYGLVFPEEDFSGLPPVPVGGPGVYPIHAASGVGFGQHYAPANYLEFAPDGWLPAVRYLVEELGADVNARDYGGYTPLHHAASRGDNELILYLVEQGADPLAVARSGQTTADMANSPFSRLTPYPETVRLLEGMGAKNNNNCQSC